MAQVENIFSLIVRGLILLTELSGILVIVLSMGRALVGYIKGNSGTRIRLAKGIMLGLEFKVGSEVLRSTIVSGWNELATLAAVILLRSLLTFLLHWEISGEEKRIQASCGTPNTPGTPGGQLLNAEQQAECIQKHSTLS